MSENTATRAVRRRLTLVAAELLLLLPAIVMVLVTWAGPGEVQGAATWALLSTARVGT
jgi:hypothetical protein